MKMESLDHELMEEIRNRALKTRELRELNVKPDGLEQQMIYDLKHIKTVCKDDGLDWKPYVNHYYEIFYGVKK